jgi:glycosyltransferase involved in cell wall biosynthesis
MKIYPWLTLKRYIEQLIMLPFVLLGRIIALCKPLPEAYDVFFFFPSYGIGGAEKINAAVVAAMKDKKVIVFFTKVSPNSALKHMFTLPHVAFHDISRHTDNKKIYWMNFIYRGICAQYINSQKKRPAVFNGQCNFAYKLFPHLRRDIVKAELIHTSEKKFGWVTFPYVPLIDKRVMIAQNIIDQNLRYYRELGIPGKYDARIHKIFYTAPVPPVYVPKQEHDRVRIYYVGRGGYQKRVNLIMEIVRQSLAAGLPFEFHFAGSFEDEIPEDVKPHIHWHGIISGTAEMYALHQQMDIMIMTSLFEGFPIAIMEAMSCGVAIVSTAVDGIPEHIVDYEGGLLIREMDEQQIVASGLEKLRILAGDKALLAKISRHNHQYALDHFSVEVFDKAYRDLLEIV